MEWILEKENDMAYTIEWLLDRDESYRYQMLDRMRTDCAYHLGNGQIFGSHLWAGNIEDQIDYMQQLWKSFDEDKKPTWLTWDQILQYEKDMKQLERIK